MIIRLLLQWKSLDALNHLGLKEHSKNQQGHYQLPFVEIPPLSKCLLKFLPFPDQDLEIKVSLTFSKISCLVIVPNLTL